MNCRHFMPWKSFFDSTSGGGEMDECRVGKGSYEMKGGGVAILKRVDADGNFHGTYNDGWKGKWNSFGFCLSCDGNCGDLVRPLGDTCGECGQELPAFKRDRRNPGKITPGIYMTVGKELATVKRWRKSGTPYCWIGAVGNVTKESWTPEGRVYDKERVSDRDLVKRIGDLEEGRDDEPFIEAGSKINTEYGKMKVATMTAGDCDGQVSGVTLNCEPVDRPALAIEGIGRYRLRNDLCVEITQNDGSSIPWKGTIPGRRGRKWWHDDGTFPSADNGDDCDVVERLGDLERPTIAISGVGVYGLRNGDVATITVDDKSDNAPFGGRIDSRPDDVLKWWWLRSGESYTVAGKEDYDVVERISDLPYDESQMKKWARWRAWSPLSKRWQQFENEPRIIDGSYWPIGGRNKKIKKPKAPPAPAEGVRWQDTLKESEK